MFLRPGNELVVTRIDRLARSIGDLQDLVREMRAKGASLRATEQPIGTSTAAGKAFLDMLGVGISRMHAYDQGAGGGSRRGSRMSEDEKLRFILIVSAIAADSEFGLGSDWLHPRCAQHCS